jgi:hypothetical protein
MLRRVDRSVRSTSRHATRTRRGEIENMVAAMPMAMNGMPMPMPMPMMGNSMMPMMGNSMLGMPMGMNVMGMPMMNGGMGMPMMPQSMMMPMMMMPGMMNGMMGGTQPMMCKMTCEMGKDGMVCKMMPMDSAQMEMMKERCNAMQSMLAMGTPCMMMCGGVPMMMCSIA